jgi:putative transposase
MSPETAFRSDKEALRFVDPDVLTNAFLHCEPRKVNKSGCISFMDRKYEVGIKFMNCTVDVVYDPADISELTIEYEGHQPWRAKELVIGERAGKRLSCLNISSHNPQIHPDCLRLQAAGMISGRLLKLQPFPFVLLGRRNDHV